MSETLQIDDLVEECLDYIYTNMDEVLAVTQTFSSMGDILITRYVSANIKMHFLQLMLVRLARRFCPSELEGLADSSDKVKSRLFAKVIFMDSN
jgi:hypothetical protein